MNGLINVGELVKRIIKYLVEGLMVAIAAYAIPKRSLNVEEIILIAGDMGYSKMRLDTVSKLKSAIGLYQKMGFYEIESYYQNPDPTVKYMEFEI